MNCETGTLKQESRPINTPPSVCPTFWSTFSFVAQNFLAHEGIQSSILDSGGTDQSKNVVELGFRRADYFLLDPEVLH